MSATTLIVLALALNVVCASIFIGQSHSAKQQNESNTALQNEHRQTAHDTVKAAPDSSDQVAKYNTANSIFIAGGNVSAVNPSKEIKPAPVKNDQVQLPVEQAPSDTNDPDQTIRLFGGWGSSVPAEGFFTLAGELTYQKDIHVLSIRYVSNAGAGYNYPYPEPLVTDLGVLYGLALLRGKAGLLAISVGVEEVNKTWPVVYLPSNSSLATPTKTTPTIQALPLSNNQATTVATNTLGYAYQAQIMWNIVHDVGLGVLLYGDANNIFSHFGVILGAQVGWF